MTNNEKIASLKHQIDYLSGVFKFISGDELKKATDRVDDLKGKLAELEK